MFHSFFNACITFVISSSVLLLHTGCKPEFKADFETAGGFVIGKERCQPDSTADYWLIDLSVYPARQYGDTLNLDGITYYEVVKTVQLAPEWKRIGAKISLDFYISAEPVRSSSCPVTNPQTYSLREVQILRQGPLR